MILISVKTTGRCEVAMNSSHNCAKRRHAKNKLKSKICLIISNAYHWRVQFKLKLLKNVDANCRTLSLLKCMDIAVTSIVVELFYFLSLFYSSNNTPTSFPRANDIKCKLFCETERGQKKWREGLEQVGKAKGDWQFRSAPQALFSPLIRKEQKNNSLPRGNLRQGEGGGGGVRGVYRSRFAVYRITE